MVEREVKLKFEAAGADEVANATSKIGRTFRSTSRDANTLEKSSKGLTSAFSGLGTKLLLLPQSLVNAGRVISRIASTVSDLTIGIIESGGSIADTAGSFAKLAEKGIDTANVLERLRVATQGQVSNFELMKIALGSLGGETSVSVDQLEKLVQAIFVTGKGLNRELLPALQMMRKSLATGSLTTLASVEGFENLTKVLERAKLSAREQGQRIDRLTLLQIGLSEAVRQANRQIDQFGDVVDSAGDRLTRLQTDFQNLIDKFQLAVVQTPRLNTALADLEKFLQAAFGSTDDLATVLGTKFGEALGYIIELIPDMIAGFESARASGLRWSADMVRGIAYVVEAIRDFTPILKILELAGVIDDTSALNEESVRLSRELVNMSVNAEQNAKKFEELAEKIRDARTEMEISARLDKNKDGQKIEIETKVSVDDSVERTMQILKEKLGSRAEPLIRAMHEQALLNAQAAQG